MAEVSNLLFGPGSVEYSQDVSHVIRSAFHSYALHDLDSDVVRNILAARGSKDGVHESYVDLLDRIKNGCTKVISSVAHLETHIMQAQTRVVSATERQISSVSEFSCEQFEGRLKPTLRDCIDGDLLTKNNLLSPNDFFSVGDRNSSKPKGPSNASYLKPLARGATKEGERPGETRKAVVAWADTKMADDIGDYSCDEETQTVLGSFDPKNPGSLQKTSKASKKLKARAQEFWRDSLNAERREAERKDLALLMTKTRGTTFHNQQDPSEESRPIFVINPAKVEFKAYVVGRIYESTVEIRNVSTSMQFCRVIIPSTGFFSINFGEFPSENGSIAPGMACVYKVRFAPDAMCDFHDSIEVQIPGRPSIVVPILAHRTPPILNLPAMIDAGDCLVGSTKVMSLHIKNRGGDGRFCILPASVWPCGNFKQATRGSSAHQRIVDVGDDFRITPAVFRLREKEKMIIQISFSPLQIRQYSTKFVLVCDNCQVQTIKIVAEGVQIAFSAAIDGGFYNSKSLRPSNELFDAFATQRIAFQPVNVGMGSERMLHVRNGLKIDIPFIWTAVKPHLLPPSLDDENPESQLAKIPDCRVVEDQPAFYIRPLSGVFAAGQTIDFSMSFVPFKLGLCHSAMHLVVPGVPQITELASSSSASPAPTPPSPTGFERSPTTLSSIGSASLSRGRTTRRIIADVTALEIDVRGNCEAYAVSLQPCGIFADGPLFIRTSSRHPFFLHNSSFGPAAFEWQTVVTDNVIIEVEPKVGIVEPGSSMELKAIITGTKAVKISEKVLCWVKFCPDAIQLHVEAIFRGPDIQILGEDDALLGSVDFGLVRFETSAMQQIFIRNNSHMDASWNLSVKHELDEADFDVAPFSSDELKISCSSGILAAFETCPVAVTFSPGYNTGRRAGYFQLDVTDAPLKAFRIFADVQKPEICLISSECVFEPASLFVTTTSEKTIVLANKTGLSAKFCWDDTLRYLDASMDGALEFSFEPKQGTLGPREQLPIILRVKPLKSGSVDAIATCQLPDTLNTLLLHISGNSIGLEVEYSVFTPPSSANSRKTPIPEASSDFVIDFGEVKIGQVSRRQLIVKNKTMIPADVCLNVGQFKSSLTYTANFTEQDLRRQFLSTDPHVVSDARSKVLLDGRGMGVVPIPARCHLPADGTAVVDLFCMADMWGSYRDCLISVIGDLDANVLEIKAEVTGQPLLFQMMVAQRHKAACARFGVAVQGTPPVTKKLRLMNEGPEDIRLDWRTYDYITGDVQLVDAITYCGNPFPLLPPDLGSRHRNLRVEEVEQGPIDEDDNRLLVSLVLRKHEGTMTECGPDKNPPIFSVSPQQLIIKGRSHATIKVILDPRQVPTSIPKGERQLMLQAYALGFVSLETASRIGHGGEGKASWDFRRKNWYDIEPIRLEFTAQIQPAVLTMETVDDDLSFSIPASLIVSKTLYSDIESISVDATSLPSPPEPVTLRFFNFHETKMTLTADVPFPFKILGFESTLRGKFIDKAVLETPQIDLPANDTLHVTIGLVPAISMLSDLASLVPNLALTEGRYMTLMSTGESFVHYRRYLTIRFSNGVEQSVRVSCSVPLPHVQLSIPVGRTVSDGKNVTFLTTQIGHERESTVELVNATASDTWVQLHIETDSDADRGCFKIRPNGGTRVGPTGGRRVSITITFQPRHDGVHSARLVANERISLQRFLVNLTGSGSYDERFAV